MRVLLRCDASLEIGSGHVMRCLSLAEKLRQQGCLVAFLCRDLPGHVGEIVRQKEFTLLMLPPPMVNETCHGDDLYASWLTVPIKTDSTQCRQVINAEFGSVDCLIVDHYALNDEWEGAMRSLTDQIVVIDDLANRTHDCETLIDQNLQYKMENRYHGLVAEDASLLLGPQYAMLRDEFKSARDSAANRNGTVRRILIFFGGVDPTNETGKTLEALAPILAEGIKIDLLLGNSNPRANEIRQQCETMPGVSFHQNIDAVAQLMSAADLAIGAAGTTTWERSCLGLPTLLMSIADNQEDLAQLAEEHGFGKNLGRAEKVTKAMIYEAVARLIKRPEMVRDMSRRGMELVDGRGCDRVAERILMTVGSTTR